MLFFFLNQIYHFLIPTGLYAYYESFKFIQTKFKHSRSPCVTPNYNWGKVCKKLPKSVFCNKLGSIAYSG